MTVSVDDGTSLVCGVLSLVLIFGINTFSLVTYLAGQKKRTCISINFLNHLFMVCKLTDFCMYFQFLQGLVYLVIHLLRSEEDKREAARATCCL